MTQTERNMAFFARLGRLETEEASLSADRLHHLAQLALEQGSRLMTTAAETDGAAAAKGSADKTTEERPSRTVQFRRWALTAAACLVVLAGAALLPQLTVGKGNAGGLRGGAKNAVEAPMAVERETAMDEAVTEECAPQETPAEEVSPDETPGKAKNYGTVKRGGMTVALPMHSGGTGEQDGIAGMPQGTEALPDDWGLTLPPDAQLTALTQNEGNTAAAFIWQDAACTLTVWEEGAALLLPEGASPETVIAPDGDAGADDTPLLWQWADGGNTLLWPLADGRRAVLTVSAPADAAALQRLLCEKP